MPIYEYKTLTPQGQQQQGVYTANSMDEVYIILKQQGSFPISVNEIEEESRAKSLVMNKTLGSKTIAVFCRQFHTLLNAGVPIVQSLDILHQQTQNKKLKIIIGEVCGKVQQGLSLSEAFKIHQPIVPGLLVYMMEAGEASGSLDLILERMANHYEKEYKLNNKIKNAMIYPIILSIVTITVVIFMLTYIMPTFAELFSSNGVELPRLTQTIIAISQFIKNQWYWILGFIGSMLLILMLVRSTSTGRKTIDGILLYLPAIGKTIQTILVGRFTRTLSTLLSSGVPLLQSLEISANIVNNAIVKEGILLAKEDVQKGIPLSDPFKNLKFFPPMVISMVEIGEESGALEDLLDKTANFYDEESEAALQKLTTMIEPIMIIFMAIIIGFIIIAMLLPMFDMANVIQA